MWVMVSVNRVGIRCELIDSVGWDVEAITPLVFHHRNLECRAIRTEGDGLQTAVDADPMLEVHHIPARGQGPGRGRRDRAAVTAWAPQSAGAPEDLVIGQDAQRRQDESALERPHNERCPVSAEQFL